MTGKGWTKEVTPNNTVACFLQELTDTYSIKDKFNMEEEKTYAVSISGNYEARADMDVYVKAKTEKEACAKVEAAAARKDIFVYTDYGNYEMYDIEIEYVDEIDPESEGLADEDYIG